MLLCGGVQFLLAQHSQRFHLFYNLAHMLNGMHHVAGAGLALGADHGRTLRNPAQSFAKISGTANERRLEGVLVDVVGLVCRGQNFALINEIDADLLQNLRFREVPDAGLGHYRNRDCLDDLLDEAGFCHARHTAFGANHCGNALERHHGYGARLLRDAGLFNVHHVHDDAALQHLGKTHLQPQTSSGNTVISILLGHFIDLKSSRRS